jgi:membrane-associated phospholipid phosphatase
MPHVEARLAAWDGLLFQRFGGEAWVRRAPRWLLEYLELAYLTVYIVVPLGFGVVYAFAPVPPVDAYWTIVLIAELACYGMLPWVQTRPPRMLGLEMAIARRPAFVRRANVLVLRGGSVQANTIPSGHAAGAWATALAAGTFVPEACLPLVVLAVSITIASVVGRYHYAADAVLGVLVAVASWAGWAVVSS